MSAFLAVITTSWGLVMALAPLLQLRIVIRERDAGGVSMPFPGPSARFCCWRISNA